MISVQLTQGYVMWVSDEDANLALNFKRHAVKRERGQGIYAARNAYVNGHKRPITFHREIFDLKPGETVDHKNGTNPVPGRPEVVDNRRENLRICSHHKNTCGFHSPRRGATSKYRGVSRHRAAQKWEAAIMVSYKKIYLGLFGAEEDAALAYDAAAREHFGEFAHPNFKV